MTKQDTDSFARWVAIVGATSAIARGAAAGFARRGYNIIIASRDLEEGKLIAADLHVRFQVEVLPLEFDALAVESHAAFVEECMRVSGGRLEGVLIAFGYMTSQSVVQSDWNEARRTIETNYTGAVSILENFARPFAQRGFGFLAAVSSVAGDRGRQSNYLYGSTKAALSVYLQGLRNRLYPAGVSVTTVKPGFVDTKMTYGLPGLFLVADPNVAGETICRAVLARRDVIYVPWFWKYIMSIIRLIPEWQFKKLKL